MNATATKTVALFPAATDASPLAAPGKNLTVDGERVTAQVTGSNYAVFAGTLLIAAGELNGTEGDLNIFFAAEAVIWVEGQRMQHTGF